MEKWFLLGYLGINVIVFFMYGIDKYKAKHRKWRISESALLTGAVFGVFGALVGIRLFRHKTKKTKFLFTVLMIFLIEFTAALCLYMFVL